MIHLQFSNRVEILVDSLIEGLQARPGSLFEPRFIVAPSAAIRRHLTLEVARRHGVCANLRFVYLAQWLWQLAARVDPSIGHRSPFDVGTLTWHVHRAFGDRPWYAEQPRLGNYLSGADELMRYELATQVATVFLDYATYRNEWLEAWQRGDTIKLPGDSADQAWQAALWRRIATRLGMPGRNPLLGFAGTLRRGDAGIVGLLPATAHIFCLPDIPPLHLEVLDALGQHMDLRIQTLNPCGEFWFDVVDATRLARLMAAERHDHHEVGHRLLAGWGRQSQAHLGLLFDRLESASIDADFRPDGSPSLLARLQDSILALAEPAPGSLRLADDDRSIEIHDCHSRGRELEVLHDRLLALFADHPDLSPADVLVVMPDLESAAPLIEAVFGAARGKREIPWAITGLPRSRSNPLARAMLDLVALSRSRWCASNVMAFIEQPPVARRLGLDEDAIERIRIWLRDAGIRWGLDAGDRERLGLPASRSHSFEDGLERLFLAYALPAGQTIPFLDRLPAGDTGGSGALTLGVLSDFIQRLADFRDQCARANTPARWAEILSKAVAGFLAADHGHPEDLAEVQTAIARFATEASIGLDDEPITIDVTQASLSRLLDDPARGGVPTGSVTFSAMSSLRGLPFRVVCMIGLDDSAFPSKSQPAEFDLIAQHFRPGDRQRRVDDRGLFLDHVLAARQYLHLSHVGHSIRDNSILPPSVLVAELIDWITARIASDPNDDQALARARSRIVVEQPLQAFSARAFRADAPSRIASFNEEFAGALNARRERRAKHAQPAPVRVQAPTLDPRTDQDPDSDESADDDTREVVEPALPFFTTPLAVPAQSWRTIELARLVGFFRNPCRFLLDRRLGIRLAGKHDVLEDDEPLVAGYDELKSLSARLLPVLIGGGDPPEALHLAIAGPDLPPGALGQRIAGQEVNRIHRFAQRIRACLPASPPVVHTGRIELDIDGEEWRIGFALNGIGPQGLVRYRDAKASANDYLDAWLHHLVLAVQPAAGSDASVCWMLRDATIRFAPVGNPAEILTDLLRLYRDGLRWPLDFFPKSAWAYANADWKMTAAAAAWNPTDHAPHAEGADPWYRLALRGRADPLAGPDSRFDACARAVFGPLRAHLNQTEVE
jgi:exodeoxyribonuclease V gamma subunit